MKIFMLSMYFLSYKVVGLDNAFLLNSSYILYQILSMLCICTLGLITHNTKLFDHVILKGLFFLLKFLVLHFMIMKRICHFS